MLILGHRGASSTFPENTLAAFAAAYDAGADGLEFDVRASRDGVPILSHDRELDRRAGMAGHIDELTLDELKRLDVGNGERIPTLEEALTAIAGRGLIDIEVKQPGIEREILAVLERFPEQRWAISSFDWTVLRAFRDLSPTADLWLLAVNPSPALIDTARELGAGGVALWAPAYTREVATELHDARLAVIVWTVNDVEEAKRVHGLGAIGLCTDDPAKMVAAFTE